MAGADEILEMNTNDVYIYILDISNILYIFLHINIYIYI